MKPGETITVVGDIRDPKIKGETNKYIADFTKLHNKDMAIFNQKEVLDKLASGDFDGVSGIILNLTARNIADEKGTMAEGDVRRADVLQDFESRLKRWWNNNLKGGKLTERQGELVAELNAMTSDVKKKYYNEFTDRYANLIQNNFPPSWNVSKEAALNMLQAESFEEETPKDGYVSKYKKGDIVDGYEFLGGDDREEQNWKEVE